MLNNDSGNKMMSVARLNKAANRGTFLIEALVGIAIIVSAVIAAFFYYGTALKVAKQSTDRVQAGIILSETAEAVRSMRDNSWDNINSLSGGTNYHLNFSAGSWQATTTPQIIAEKFTRTFTVLPVSRDSNEDIVLSGGAVDPDIKEIIMKVEWNTSGELSATGRLYLANIFE
jgi:Tfp pilus assembly protein PilV